MKPKIILSILAGILAFPVLGTFAQTAPITFVVLATFDYPGTGNLTRPQKINAGGEIAGEFVDSSGATRGFIRYADGTFSAPIIDPNDTVGFTEGRGINDAGTVCGDYSDGAAFHGFFLTGSTYTQYDVPGALSTLVLGLNNAGDFVGNITASDGSSPAFISLGGNVTTFSAPGATFTAAYQLNSSGQAVGYYVDSSSISHGFARNQAGAIRYPLDPPGTTGTIVFGFNDQDAIVGRYSDSAGATHGLYIVSNHYVTYDYPGSSFTSLNGINDQGLICGRYIDSSGIEHGILLQVRHSRADQPGVESKTLNPPVVAKPVGPVPSAVQHEVPAA
ncbi:MAG: hypothetical protein ACREIF_12945 [Chthoniobacterales bacterium]